MLQFTDQQLLGWIAAWFWPFCRIGGLISTAPIYQNGVIPAPVKVVLAAVIAALISGQVESPTTVIIFSMDGMWMLTKQLIIGATLGVTIRLTFVAIELTGNLLGLQMGIGFATFFDPEHNAQTPVLGSFLNYLALLIFLGLNGHLIMLAAVVDSFHTLPLTSNATISLDWSALALQGSTIFAIGFHLALPVLATLLITNLALGVLTRAAPQLNLFSVGFPVTLMIGLVAFAMAMPYMGNMMERYMMEVLQQIGR